MMSRRHLMGATLASAALPKFAWAQTAYPDRPVRVVVPFGPGGLADVTMRIVGEKLSERLKQPVVIVNQPGAGGTAAARAVLASAADGYTLALFTNGTAISVPLVSQLGYDPIAEFKPISGLGSFDFIIASSSEHPYTTLADVTKAMQAQPGQLNIGTINVGSTQNLTAQLLKQTAGVDSAVIPFRTTGDTLTALLRKDVDIVIDGLVAMKSLLADGKLKALATTGPTESLPNVPTVAAAIGKPFDVTSWNAVFALRETPDAVVKLLNTEINAVLRDAAVKQKLLDLGIEAFGGSPETIGNRLKSDIAKWGAIIQSAGISKQ